jgi:hypothetical protein
VPKLSIIIPVVGNLTWLEDTLLSVLPNRPDDCEVVVVLDTPYDDPYQLKDEIRFVEASPQAGFVESVNLGITASRSPLIHVLLCGCQVSEGWTETALCHFNDPRVATVVPLVVGPGESPRVLAAGMSYQAGGRVGMLGRGQSPQAASRCQKRLLGASLAAGFYRKSALEMVGLFSHDVSGWLASVDLGLALEQAGFRAVLEPECRVTAAHPLARPIGTFRRSLDLERLFWRWGPRGGWPLSLTLHGFTVAAESLGGLFTLSLPSQLAGRVAGLSRIGSHRRQYQRLEQLRQLSPSSSTLAVPHFLRESVETPVPASVTHNGVTRSCESKIGAQR